MASLSLIASHLSRSCQIKCPRLSFNTTCLVSWSLLHLQVLDKTWHGKFVHVAGVRTRWRTLFVPAFCSSLLFGHLDVLRSRNYLGSWIPPWPFHRVSRPETGKLTARCRRSYKDHWLWLRKRNQWKVRQRRNDIILYLYDYDIEIKLHNTPAFFWKWYG